MKQWVLLMAALFCGFYGCLSLQLKGRFEPGFWHGEAVGRFGMVAVSVETDAVSIINIEIIEDHEDEFIGGEAMRELLELVLEEDSTNIDVISGATVSSNAFLDAVDNALQKAHRK
ncbi:MAG: FMN-binding protein [Spirochaetaceae bacterium]|nr:FMN-binding protein [Spirochaetaceae bacterium]